LAVVHLPNPFDPLQAHLAFLDFVEEEIDGCRVAGDGFTGDFPIDDLELFLFFGAEVGVELLQKVEVGAAFIGDVARGAVKVEGDAELLTLFQRLFPGPPGGASPQRSSTKP
jgi:hypothetical protein